MNRVWPFIDRLLPESLVSAGPERRQTGRLTVLFCLAVTATGPGYIALFAALGLPEMATSVALAMGVAFAGLVVLRVTASVTGAVQLMLLALWGAVVTICAHTGAHLSPAMLWFTLVPAIGMLLAGPWTAVLWSAITAATMLAFIAQGFFAAPASALDPTSQLYLWITDAVVILVLHLGLVALFSAARSRMLSEVEEARSLATEAHRRARVVLDSVNQGLALVDREARLQPGASAAAVRWFGEPRPEDTLWSWMGRADAAAEPWLRLGWEQLTADLLPPELALAQLRRELSLAGRDYDLEVRLVDDTEGRWSTAVAVITDVTEARAAARADAANRELLTVFGHLGHDRQGLLHFVEEQKMLVASLALASASAVDTLRVIHTLKGNAGLYGLTELAAHCHRLESRLLEDLRTPTVDEIHKLEVLFQGTLRRLDSVLGAVDAIVVTPAEVRQLTTAISREAPHGILANMVRRWTWGRIGARLEKLAELAGALAVRLDKGPVSLVVKANELFEAPGSFPELWTSLAHIARNAVDHGLEPRAARNEAGKGAATLSFFADVEGDQLVVRISDDGSGIDWDAVREKARAAGLAHATQADLENALWSDGISTSAGVTEVSGRGVGLAATLAAVSRLGGTVSVDSRPLRGTTFTFRVPTRGQVERLTSEPLWSEDRKRGPPAATKLLS